MALGAVNIEELRSYRDELLKTKEVYDDTINSLMDVVKLSAIYWQGIEGSLFRAKLYGLIGADLNSISSEMNAEIEYINKIIMVFENAQDQIKSRLNG